MLKLKVAARFRDMYLTHHCFKSWDRICRAGKQQRMRDREEEERAKEGDRVSREIPFFLFV